MNSLVYHNEVTYERLCDGSVVEWHDVQEDFDPLSKSPCFVRFLSCDWVLAHHFKPPSEHGNRAALRVGESFFLVRCQSEVSEGELPVLHAQHLWVTKVQFHSTGRNLFSFPLSGADDSI